MKQRPYRIGPGAASVLTAIVIFAMSIVSFMALMEAKSDQRLSNRALQFALEEARAQEAAEEMLSKLDGVIQKAPAGQTDFFEYIQRNLPEGMTFSNENTVKFTLKTNVTKSLQVSVQINAMNSPVRWRITEYAFYADNQ